MPLFLYFSFSRYSNYLFNWQVKRKRHHVTKQDNNTRHGVTSDVLKRNYRTKPRLPNKNIFMQYKQTKRINNIHFICVLQPLWFLTKIIEDLITVYCYIKGSLYNYMKSLYRRIMLSIGLLVFNTGL